MTTEKTTKKVSLEELKAMVKEAMSKEIKAIKEAKTSAERALKIKADKEKSADKEKDAKNESVKITVEQLKKMVKEAVTARLKENPGHEWGTEHDPMGDESLASLPPAEPDPDDVGLMPLKDNPTDEDLYGPPAEELKHRISQIGSLALAKQTRAFLSGRIKELEDRLNVMPADRHFAGDRSEIGEASPAYTPSARKPDAGGPPVGGLMKHDPRRAGGPGVAATTDPVVGHVTMGKEQVPVKRSDVPGRKV